MTKKNIASLTTNFLRVTPAAMVWVMAALGSQIMTLSVVGAVEVPTPPSKSVPCAILETFEGVVQVMDSSRENLLDSLPNSAIPCGGWISVKDGWAKIKHRDGYRLQTGPHTFMQLPEPNSDGHYGGDTAVLYKGQVYAQSGGGSRELRVITVNSRARIKRGTAIVLYSQAEEDTQLIAIGNSATLENRFQSQHPVKVKPGEATSLNFRALRVIPTTPRAVSVAALKQMFVSFNLSEKERSFAIRGAVRRQDRKFASVINGPGEEDEEDEAPVAKRSPAGLVFKKPDQPYDRHTPHAEDGNLNEHWVRKIVGGQGEGEEILYPKKSNARAQVVKVHVVDPLAGRKSKRSQEDELERQRLIKELSQIRPE